METLIRRRVQRRLIWVCTVCQLHFSGIQNTMGKGSRRFLCCSSLWSVISYVAFVVSLFGPHFFPFDAWWGLYFMIVAFPGYLHSYFCRLIFLQKHQCSSHCLWLSELSYGQEICIAFDMITGICWPLCHVTGLGYSCDNIVVFLLLLLLFFLIFYKVITSHLKSSILTSLRVCEVSLGFATWSIDFAQP